MVAKHTTNLCYAVGSIQPGYFALLSFQLSRRTFAHVADFTELYHNRAPSLVSLL
jgi:hypothetical protein